MSTPGELDGSNVSSGSLSGPFQFAKIFLHICGTFLPPCGLRGPVPSFGGDVGHASCVTGTNLLLVAPASDAGSCGFSVAEGLRGDMLVVGGLLTASPPYSTCQSPPGPPGVRRPYRLDRQLDAGALRAWTYRLLWLVRI